MILAAIKKEATLLIRDRGALLSLFALPVVFTVVFGTMMATDDGSARRSRLAVWADGDNELAQRVVVAVRVSTAFDTQLAGSAQLVRDRVANEEVALGLVLSRDFDPKGGVPAELVIDEATSPQLRGPLEASLSAIIQAVVYEGREAPVLRAVSPPGLRRAVAKAGGFQVAVPGNAVLFVFFLALTVALSFVEERTSGTWLRLLAAPVPKPYLIVAKLVPFFFVGLVQMAFLFGIGALAFGMTIGGSLVALAAVTCAVVLCAVALGLFIASFSGTQKQVGGVGSIVLLTMALLGGAMFPRLAMSPLLQKIGLATPHAWALDAYYDLLLRRGGTVADVAVECLVLVAIATVLFVIGALRMRFEP